jgi:hypothetical protein
MGVVRQRRRGREVAAIGVRRGEGMEDEGKGERRRAPVGPVPLRPEAARGARGAGRGAARGAGRGCSLE